VWPITAGSTRGARSQTGKSDTGHARKRLISGPLHPSPMGIRDTRLERGRRKASECKARLLHELRAARHAAGVSQSSLARQLGWSQTRYSQFERATRPATVDDVCLVAVMLGLRPRFDLFREDEGVRDQGHQRLIARFCAILSSLWSVHREAPFPTLGDLRSWDVLIRLGTAFRVGVEAETRVRDQQELVRRIRQRELHGGVDAIVVLLSDSAHNRRLVGELRESLGPDYATPARSLIRALRTGQPLPGSGVIVL
jgi:transcriptional regulator with XRE-family HTH domain